MMTHGVTMNRKGAILVFVLLIILVVVMLANAALSIVNSQGRFTHHEVSRIRAFYACEGARNIAFERIRGGNTNSFSICPDAAACAVAPVMPDQLIDPDIPFRVDVTVGAQGSAPAALGGAGGLGGQVRQLTITATYTYTAP